MFMFCSRPGPRDTVIFMRAPEGCEKVELSVDTLLSCGVLGP